MKRLKWEKRLEKKLLLRISNIVSKVSRKIGLAVAKQGNCPKKAMALQMHGSAAAGCTWLGTNLTFISRYTKG